jgi:adenine phosphoribosyltransferase
MESISDLLRRTIRDVPDFPKKGIVFKDITPVLGDGETYRRVIDELVTRWKPKAIDQVESIRETYMLEYGQDGLELHIDAVGPGERVLIVDDLLATGGTAEAVGKLVLRQGAELVGYSFVVELSFLHGARRLGTQKVDTLVTF